MCILARNRFTIDLFIAATDSKATSGPFIVVDWALFAHAARNDHDDRTDRQHDHIHDGGLVPVLSTALVPEQALEFGVRLTPGTDDGVVSNGHEARASETAHPSVVLARASKHDVRVMIDSCMLDQFFLLVSAIPNAHDVAAAFVQDEQGRMQEPW